MVCCAPYVWSMVAFTIGQMLVQLKTRQSPHRSVIPSLAASFQATEQRFHLFFG